MQTVYKCNPNAEPSPTSARRLSKYEYTQSVYLLVSTLPTTELTTVKAAMAALLMSVPEDSGLKFDSDDYGITEGHTAAYYTVARGLATEIVKSDTRLKAFAGSCASISTTPSASCVSAFLTQKAMQILRRPLTEVEIATMSSDMAGKWKSLLTRLLMHPSFLFQTELEGSAVKSGILKVSPYELASRISFHVVKQAPDAALLAKAADGSIMQKEVIRSEIKRLISTYPLQATYSADKFFEGWMAYKRVAHPVAGSSAPIKAFTSGQTLQRDSLIAELTNMTRYYLNQGQGSFEDLFLSPYSFASNADLASLYGVAAYNPASDTMVAFPQKQRAGLLNRAAFLISGNVDTSPIIRGLRVRREFLCEEITPPPASIAAMVRDPVFDPTLSTRVRFENKTASTACMGCHVAINPLGFSLENFDGYGRFRTVEKVFDPVSGELLNQIPVDPVVQPQVTLHDSRSISSSAEFHELISESGKARACMVESFYRYIHYHAANREADSCDLLEMDELASSPGGLNKLFYEAPLTDRFQLRKLD